jgi:uncharacterized protein (TIGR02421 family)
MSKGKELYRRTVRELSDRLVEAQRPIRILDAIKWDPSIQTTFFEKGFREEPAVTRDYYLQRKLGFDADGKRQEFYDIGRDIQRRLGQFNPVGNIMRRICREYRLVLRMLEARGTPEFSLISQELYGSAGDVFHPGDPTLADLGQLMIEALANLDRSSALQAEERTLGGEDAAAILAERLGNYFQGSEIPVRVVVSDGIIADAAAGSDYLKIRKEARFNQRDLRLLEIHEGWVHLATTINGLSQPYCTFLGKGPPSATTTQEGLAMLMEVVGFASYPGRLRRLTNRIQGVYMAEQGATFREVFHYFREQGLNEEESFTDATRVFRGSAPGCGPFTKDITYSKGFILIYNYIRLAVKRGLLNRIPLLFCGKTTLEDIRTLADLVQEGLVIPPRFLPPQFADISALTAWMCYSNFLNRLNLAQIEADYAALL